MFWLSYFFSFLFCVSLFLLICFSLFFLFSRSLQLFCSFFSLSTASSWFTISLHSTYLSFLSFFFLPSLFFFLLFYFFLSFSFPRFSFFFFFSFIFLPTLLFFLLFLPLHSIPSFPLIFFPSFPFLLFSFFSRSMTMFNLAPIGMGRASFRLGEIIQLGRIPIYLYEDFPWSPYEGSGTSDLLPHIYAFLYLFRYSLFSIIMSYLVSFYLLQYDTFLENQEWQCFYVFYSSWIISFYWVLLNHFLFFLNPLHLPCTKFSFILWSSSIIDFNKIKLNLVYCK